MNKIKESNDSLIYTYQKGKRKGKSLEYQILHFCLPLNDEAGGAVIEV